VRRSDCREAGARLLALLERENALDLLNLLAVREARALLCEKLISSGAGAAELREAFGLETLQAARAAMERHGRKGRETAVAPLPHTSDE
jgi:hypothetical protein